MRLSRLYTDQAMDEGIQLTLDKNSSHYLLHVLRLKPGNALIMFNGNGFEYNARLEQATKKQAVVSILERMAPQRESPLHIEIGQGIARGERMDFVLQKSVELGASVISPLWTQHSQVRLDEKRLEKRLEHWKGVVVSACEQSGRLTLPEIRPPSDLASWLEAPTDSLDLVLSPCSGKTLKDLQPASDIRILIGPEGGLQEDEIRAAEANGFQAIRLGPRILRTETAALATLTALQVLWGDLSA
ncbi:16S rRNA m(3)U-1498 methyltransferase [Thiogranum longum]|uniref:Ribosomal RNA small subunit methyltransferase E n=1 Tax=Thiogranum longum TaxID=1537524 RepID=A0A4R1HAJ6_9GAMM|nr:16S rRNA (uracil(1498)-N(3))-methyltransferase [Thiogranum longum]TCK17150.1 16S rRNA m(3)U-1498 methyltransferase [Thiogranum longum]